MSGVDNAADESTIKESCKRLCDEYNAEEYDTMTRGTEILRELFGSLGDGFRIRTPFICDYGKRISAGSGFTVNNDVVMHDERGITFGDNVMIGPECEFFTVASQSEEELDVEKTGAITVENDVWIGKGVKVMPGVTIGHDVIVGAGSVVVTSIPSNSITQGNPCKVVRPLDSLGDVISAFSKNTLV